MGRTGRAAGAGTAAAFSAATGRSAESRLVALATERVMPGNAAYKKRAKVLNHARGLARSGEHADHQGIILQLVALEDFEAVRGVFADRAICLQLDRLCARARKAAA
jgi:hypothetical protein